MSPFLNNLGRKLYRLFLWDEYDDEYVGYEEQGISYRDWKNHNVILSNSTKDSMGDEFPLSIIPEPIPQ